MLGIFLDITNTLVKTDIIINTWTMTSIRGYLIHEFNCLPKTIKIHLWIGRISQSTSFDIIKVNE